MTLETKAPIETTTALVRFGYTQEEAAFLKVAALQGGYFLRRQINQFWRCGDGGAATALVQKVQQFEHASCSSWQSGVHLYHLYSRPLYDAIGDPNNRNRRRHALGQIKRRVMNLDFVLNHSDVQFLATERDKCAAFEAMGIGLDVLPHRSFPGSLGVLPSVRFFVDKDPIFVQAASIQPGGITPTFAFIDEGQRTLCRYERFLEEHARLFAALTHCQVAFVAERPTHVAAARARFERALSVPLGPQAPDHGALLQYFELRKRFESREFGSFDREQLVRLRNARDAFSAPEFEARYARWRATGDLEIETRNSAAKRDLRHVSRTFLAELLTHDYAFLDPISKR